jgi:hypothetical protein
MNVKADGAYSYHYKLNAQGTLCFPYASSLISPSRVSVDRLVTRRYHVLKHVELLNVNYIRKRISYERSAQSGVLPVFNPLQTKHKLLYLKTQSVPHCKNFSSRL